MIRCWFVFGLCVAGASACSLLVKPEEADPRCLISDERRDPCPDGTSCILGRCAKSQCQEREVCGDGIDNDCDDKVDEPSEDVAELCNLADDDCDGLADEDYDQDGDGVTSCGDLTEVIGTYDCDPRNAAVHPKATEICDGLDNDCDGNTDEPTDGQLQCTSEQICSNGICKARSCSVPDSGISCDLSELCINDTCVLQNCPVPCGARQHCDQTSFTCATSPQVANGEACTANEDCLSNTCIDSAALKLPATPHRICGKACCSDAECGANETCFAPGTGARSCLPRALVFTAASSCMLSSDCTNQVCAVGETLAGAGRLATALCRTPTLLDQNYGDSCTRSEECATNLCVLGAIFAPDLCSAPCRTSADCGTLQMAAAGLTAPLSYCQFVELGDYNAAFAGNYLPICVLSRLDTGSAASGAACRTSRDCADGACIGASVEAAGKCAKTCCNDSQCRTTDKPNVRCLPVARGTNRFEMRCIE